MTRLRPLSSLLLLSLTFILLTPQRAQAFCGLYVSGADTKLYNNATQVVMMREGTKTVLSMQNNYEGPPQDFAMVVPVPVVLQRDNVKTLGHYLFDKIDQLTSPRLVEYHEQDPCVVYQSESRAKFYNFDDTLVKAKAVKVKARFTVGEYDIVILSAKDSTSLERWLRNNRYNIPKMASEVLRAYIELGMYFFVAKVNIKKVQYKKIGSKKVAVLSPLRFHYDSDSFSLPVRLGLLNANGPQDLIIHILARQRYEVANYKNVTIPTNLIVDQAVRQKFGEFYNALFDYTIKENPGAVVTEYSWDASTCDPCPGPVLTPSELLTLGADVLGKPNSSFTLTRLHARYDAETLKDDLVFKSAAAIFGGRGTPTGERGALYEQGAQLGNANTFQGRYILLTPWTKKNVCETPVRGQWGGNPQHESSITTPFNLAYIPRDNIQLRELVKNLDAPGLSKLSPPAAP